MGNTLGSRGFRPLRWSRGRGSRPQPRAGEMAGWNRRTRKYDAHISPPPAGPALPTSPGVGGQRKIGGSCRRLVIPSGGNRRRGGEGRQGRPRPPPPFPSPPPHVKGRVRGWASRIHGTRGVSSLLPGCGHLATSVGKQPVTTSEGGNFRRNPHPPPTDGFPRGVTTPRGGGAEAWAVGKPRRPCRGGGLSEHCEESVVWKPSKKGCFRRGGGMEQNGA